MQQILSTQLWQRLQAGEKPFLLDVREPYEFEICHIEGSVNMPMGQVFVSFNELNPDVDTIVICHHGIRSAQIANFLLGHGFKSVTNLQGGIANWASEVDPAMPRY